MSSKRDCLLYGSQIEAAQIRKAARALRKRIRAARAGAKQGDIFTPETRIEFRNALALEVDANTWAAIMDDNPGERSNRINGAYPEGRALSTVPPNVLAVLPRLPADVRYGFLGRHLILLDTRANVILDRIPLALQLAAPAPTPFEDLRGAADVDWGPVSGQWRAMRDGNGGIHGNRGNVVSVSYRI